MNKTLVFLWVLFVSGLCLTSCRHKSVLPALQRADSLTYTFPDSAISLLQQLKDTVESLPRSEQMYYHLLTVKADDKAYVLHTSDSLITKVVDYYEKSGDEHRLPEAYYYAGRVYSDLNDAPQALDYYQRAAELLQDGNDYKLLRVVCSQMGELFMYQEVYEEAMKHYGLAYQYSLLTNDKRATVLNMCYVGLSHMAFGRADSAIICYQKAFQLAQEYGQKRLIDKTLSSLADIYQQTGQYELALKSFRMLDAEQKEIIGNLSVAGDLYYDLGMMDSALYYYNRLLETDDIYAQRAANKGCANVARAKGEYHKALEYMEHYICWDDSIKSVTNSESIRRQHTLYDYQLREEENYKLKANNAKQKRVNTYILFLMVLLAMSFVIYVQYSKWRSLMLRTRLEKLATLKEEQYKRSNQFIEENKRTIEQLERKLQDSNYENESMRNLLLAQKEQLLHLNNKVKVDIEEQSLAETALRQSDIYCKFYEASVNGEIKIEAKDWEQLRLSIDTCYKDFSKRLRAIYPMSDIELKISLLLKINISVTGIAHLTMRSKSAIVSARKKLYEKVFGEPGKAEQWDAFIAAL